MYIEKYITQSSTLFFPSLQIKNYLFLAYSPALSLQVSGLHCACRSTTSSYFPIRSPISYSINAII